MRVIMSARRHEASLGAAITMAFISMHQDSMRYSVEGDRMWVSS